MLIIINRKPAMQLAFACFYFIPHPFHQVPLPETLPLDASTFITSPETRPVSLGTSINKSEEFLKQFELQLKKTSTKYLKKVWTKEDDNLLLQMRKQNFKWTQIAQQIPYSNPQICKRRHSRLKQDAEKWPPELEEEIKRVCSLTELKWDERIKILHSKFPEAQNYSKKMIKERYLTYLEDGIEQKAWTIEEDLALIRMLQKGAKRWKLIAQVLPGRTELHLKNRYYGCLRAIEQKIEKKIRKQKL